MVGSELKKWPGSGIVNYSELMDPVRKAFNTAYRLVRKKRGDIPYDGYELGKWDQATSPIDPVRLLSQEYQRMRSEQGEDLMDLTLNIAFRLGMEQGRRQVQRYLCQECRSELQERLNGE
jgi:hypothetical protein